jgi:acyl dehydratase
VVTNDGGTMDDDSADELEATLAALIGRPMGGHGAKAGPDPVNLPMIRHWTAAFDDDNPIHVDAEFAASTRHGQIVAPPLMLQTWTMATPIIEGIRERGGSPVEITSESTLAVLDRAGYTGTLATNSEFEILRYLHLGDTVSAESFMDAISPEKQTRLGPGRFVTWVTIYRDQDDEIVGKQTFRVLKFKTGGGVA